ncbi:MAG: hypothetical protein ABI230_11800 [Aestuariivirga sp.]
MIVNDKEGEKTLDQETGVYLTKTEEYPREGYVYFRLVDSETEIDFQTTRWSESRPDGTHFISYRVANPVTFKGECRRKNYRNLVVELLEEYKLWYGPWPKTTGPTVVEVSFDDSFLAPFKIWEGHHGN